MSRSTSRREFVKRSAVLAGAVGLGAWRGRPLDAEPEAGAGPGPAPRPLRILILGGTGFIGPHEVDYARARGHHLTLFNRGKTHPGLFPNIEQLHGDRNGGLESLKGKRWDVCIDNSASNIEWVRSSAALLKDAVHRYLYVSSISAYSDMSTPGMDEDAPTFTYESAGVSRDAKKLPYGLQKALCERETRRVFGARGTVVRPGLIVGPRDPTDRFTYWPVRVHRGGDVLAPGTPADPTQIIDARDLTGFMIRLVENDAGGTFNATGHSRGMADLLKGIRAAEDADCTFTWADAAFLAAHDVKPWSDMPVWVPDTRETAGFARVDIRRAIGAGLTFLPLAKTARDTLAWFQAQPAERRAHLRSGLTPEREAEVLKAWKSRAEG
ncbi:MAG: NAD-dependent epimerase/dehydratase family protein [Candidatus Palauibacterales bacterium]|nr:NAD-dependent epimerase/dehydratase family protein [Candidatus Palauibacterales bacterium]MDP2530378.1 NAD-dependent epimerase/dehydratase family protein [Candidatus Palauibacterales bacterium]MDP2585064.1 NAD-dependent epimerase/dehydratase family protein [Candidatus Palauibacterales bacterium]